MKLTLGILALTIALMVQGKVRAELAALGGLLALMLCGILTPQEALSGFSSPTVLTIAGLFVVGGAVFHTGLAAIVSRRLLALAGVNETTLFIVIMLVTSCIGAFVSNSGTVAVMMPIVASLSAAAGVSQRRFLMPLAFASSMGGMFTLIGVLSNLIINGVLVEAGYESLKFFSFFPVGLACVTLGMVTLLPVSKWLLSEKPVGSAKKTARENPALSGASAKSHLENKAPVAAAVVVLMITGMVSGVAPNFAIVLIAAMTLVFTGCFRSVPEAYANIRWEVIILVAAMFPITIAVEKSGLIQEISSFLTQSVGGLGPYALMAALYAATSITTLFITNAATSLIFAPIALQTAVDMQLSPYPLLMGVAVGASMCFASPFSTPANTMVMAPGRYTFMDYVKVGVPLQILYGVIMVFFLPLLFPFAPA